MSTQQNTLALACAPQSMEQLWKFAQTASKTALVPQGFRGKPEDCYIAIQMGLELGLKPLQALSGIAVVNGKPSIYGDSLMALVRSFPECEYVVESFDDATMTATCRSKRKGQPEQITTFSKKDAETAKLWGKQGPWAQYPKRMLQMRARGFNLRDVFPDALMGIITMEEARDYPTKEVEITDITPTPSKQIEVKTELTEKGRTIEEARDALELALENAGLSVPSIDIQRAQSELELKAIWDRANALAKDMADEPMDKATDSERASFWGTVEAEELADYLPQTEREEAKTASAERLDEMLELARDLKSNGGE